MIRRLAAALIASALVAGCETFTPGGRTVKACRENLISNLNDRESYREDSKPKEIQAEPGQPKVWGWYFNAKNAMGGYGEGKELLCYQEDKGRIVQEIFRADQFEDRRYFLAQTSPEIKKEIEDEISAAAAEKAKRDAAAAEKKAAEKAAVAARVEASRKAAAAADAEKQRLYNQHLGELRAFCNAKYTGRKMDFSSADITDWGFASIQLNNACQNNFVNTWRQYRSRICPGYPQFCKR